MHGFVATVMVNGAPVHHCHGKRCANTVLMCRLK